ncbi:MAG: sulfatase-like hydrolase/transferase [Chitinivibrionales bacterium]|nr:sulfatase-like hydrolase/transferase [Chitinivibrionales bacterium]
MHKSKQVSRRNFINTIGLGAAAVALPRAAHTQTTGKSQNQQPNILWITIEDASPYLGCYGDDLAKTPNIDKLASEGVRYTNCYSPSGVCAPSRSALLTGMYPVALGSQHHRFDQRHPKAKLPSKIKPYPTTLKEAGYHVSNNFKNDMNLSIDERGLWDVNETEDFLWRQRPANAPFFHVRNSMTCHEGKVRSNRIQYLDLVNHDQNDMVVAPYHPDTDKSRRCMAYYYQTITNADKEVKTVLDGLDADGLTDDTIIFFYSDHGGCMPRGKRWTYDSGLRTSLIVKIPPKFRVNGQGQPASVDDRLVSFVDFVPTLLNLTGLPIPDYLQGQPFLGDNLPARRTYIYGARDRLDERYDMVRAVRDNHYKYLCNFEPWKPYQQVIQYKELNMIMQDMRRLEKSGELTGAVATYMAQSRPVEELYDCDNDPHEINNLAGSVQHRQILERMRRECLDFMKRIHDTGIIPEGELRKLAETHGSEFEIFEKLGSTTYEKWLQAADRAHGGRAHVDDMIDGLSDADAVVRYWSVIGIMLNRADAASADTKLIELLQDPCGDVRVMAARSLMLMGRHGEAIQAFKQLMNHDSGPVRLRTANEIENLGHYSKPLVDSLESWRTGGDKSQYVLNVLKSAVETIPAASVAIKENAQKQAAMDTPFATHDKYLTVTNRSIDTINVELFNARGKLVMTRKVLPGAASNIDQRKLAAGSYVAKTQLRSSRCIHRFTVSK